MGELKLGSDPDCNQMKTNCAPKRITREITSDNQIIVHESYTVSTDTLINDIALIRLNEAVPLYAEDPSISYVTPICLPWSKDYFAR